MVCSAACALDWHLLQYGLHRGVQDMVRCLNGLYRNVQSLHDLDFARQGFEWIDCHDAQQSVLCFERRARQSSCNRMRILHERSARARS